MKKPKILLIGMLVVMGVQVHASPQEEWIEVTSTGAEFKYVGHDDALGDLWEAPNKVIWTEVVKRPDGTTHFMNTVDAGNYCKSHGALLPSQEDYEKYRRFNGYGTEQGYNSPFFSESGRFATSSSSVVPKHPERAIFFYETTNNGEFGSGDPKYLHAIRCIKYPQDGIIHLEANDPKVQEFPEFANSGDVYYLRALDLLLSVTPLRSRSVLDVLDANLYCSNLDAKRFLGMPTTSGGATAPTREQLQAIAQVMGKGTVRGYNPDLIPGMRGRWFWSSSTYGNGSFARFDGSGFDGDNGDVGHPSSHFLKSVLCVRPATSTATDLEITTWMGIDRYHRQISDQRGYTRLVQAPHLQP